MLPRACRSVAALSMMMGLAAASHASDWGTVVAISSTMGVHGDRVCVGEATRGDIGCPTYAPQVGTDGSISATRFVGDGSGLTGVVASTADRIVSGTTSMVAVSGTGFVSLTQAGTNTGWFDPTRGLVTLGVSATGAVSATRGYFSGNTGFGVSNPLTAIDAAGALHVHDAGTAADNNYQGALRITRPSSAAQYINLVRAGNAAWSIGTVYGTSNFAIGQGAFTDSSFTNPFFVIGANGRVGIGVATPTVSLEVSGTGFVSLTQADTNTGWFDPTRGLVTLGVSATGTVSATKGYFRDAVNIGLTAPFNGFGMLNVGGPVSVSPSSWTDGVFMFIQGYVPGTGGSIPIMYYKNNILTIGNTGGMYQTGITLRGGNGNVAIVGSTAEASIFVKGSTGSNLGYVGISTTNPLANLHVNGTTRMTSWSMVNANVTPTAPLEVSGTVSATYVKLADNDDLPCTPERYGTLRFSNGIVSVCRAP